MRTAQRYLLLSSVVLSMPAPSAFLEAQSGRGGQVEIGAYGTFAAFDNTALALRRQFGVGGRYGFFLSRVFAIEANGDYTVTRHNVTRSTVNVARVGGTLLANARLGGFGSVYVGAGYERLAYRGGMAFDDDAVHVVLGDRLSLGGRTALRIEGRGSYAPSTHAPGASGNALNFTATAGLSIFAFGGAPRDADGDRVTDRRDRCPDTPMGAAVDSSGCPGDGDGDLVLNGLDVCPGTPAGATVDGRGCPSDGDGDKVFDGIDVCPETPAGASVDGNGCPTDADGDKTFDGLDQCPETPAGALVDAAGCPLDQDGDKVFDGLDQCPDTPALTQVDARGCAIVKDTDGDGVGDPSDRCANTLPNTRVDMTGCPADPDGDGVDNPTDRCPNTAAGVRVDAVGCPILFEVVEGRARPVILKGVNFQSGRSTLTPASYAALDEVAASLVANPEVRIEIAGHTDSTGVYSRNMALSLARAQAVRAYLGRKGVDVTRMVARGYGPDKPVAPNRTPAGRAQNRRVELNLISDP
jgi:outer membrane protein OmpA-like peptidoglycan-associated protein